MDVINCPRDDFKKGGHILGKWHLDFVVVHVYYGTVKFCIEYDDKSHESSERKKRDLCLNFAMSRAGVKLLRVPHMRYSVEGLKKLLSDNSCLPTEARDPERPEIGLNQKA